MYVLRSGRFELAPSYATTVNDPYVWHPALSVGLNYWVTNVLAVGANFLWYQGIESESDLNFSVRRSTRLAVPITEYQLGAHLNFTYVPIYGKFSMFNSSIFQWDSYLIGGVGMMRTRPVAVVDPGGTHVRLRLARRVQRRHRPARVRHALLHDLRRAARLHLSREARELEREAGH